jgi:hypothetical protein
MKRRCNNPNAENYPYYGGRGIKVCERWESFENFLHDMGVRPSKMTLDRKDSNGNYEPSNCRWASKADQATNTSRNVILEKDGKKMTVSQWAEELGVNPTSITLRLRRGWSHERALDPRGLKKRGAP